MNRTTVSILALSVAALSAGQALASEPAGKTRAEVKAELAQAIRTGNIVNDSEAQGGLKLNEVFPQNYAAQTQTVGKTRAQVKAELIEAQRTGDIVTDSESFGGGKLSEVFPGKYNRQS